MIWSIPTIWQFPELFLMVFCHWHAISRLPKSWTCTSTYISFIQACGHGGHGGHGGRSLLTILGRLITPFILGSMSVGLNILIRHSFTDLWVWIMTWAPWPFFAEKMWVAFIHIFFSKNNNVYAIFNDQSFNGTLTTSLVLNNWTQKYFLSEIPNNSNLSLGTCIFIV